MRFHVASTVRSTAWRSRALSLPKTCSMGLRSGAGTAACPHSLTSGVAPYRAFVAAEIILDNDAAGRQGWHQHLPLRIEHLIGFHTAFWVCGRLAGAFERWNPLQRPQLGPVSRGLDRFTLWTRLPHSFLPRAARFKWPIAACSGWIRSALCPTIRAVCLFGTLIAHAGGGLDSWLPFRPRRNLVPCE